MKARLFLVLCLGSAAAARPAEACDCDRPEPPCRMLGQSSFVFLGKATAIREIAREQFESTFAVEEVFHGTLGKTAVIRTRWDGASCDPKFKLGARLVVYANGSPTALKIGCSRLVPADGAAKEIAFLREARQRIHATAEGSVTVSDGRPGHVGPRSGVPRGMSSSA